MSDSYSCKYCGKTCKNKNSQSQHQVRCPENPERIATSIPGFNNQGRVAWNKGTTGLIHHSEETKEKLRESSLRAKEEIQSRPEYAEYRRKMSELAKSRTLGGFHFRRGVIYGDVKLDSSYEVRVAKDLDRNNVAWQRCGQFYYKDDAGVEHHYTPDCYLPDYDVYLDPKNDYLIENGQKGLPFTDKQKIDWVCEQNNIRVIILDQHSLTWEAIKSILDLPV